MPPVPASWALALFALPTLTRAALPAGAPHAGDPAEQLPETGTDVGQLFPDVALPRLDGGWGRLSDHRGKRVLLLLFASW